MKACDACHVEYYASELSRRTAEFEVDDGTIISNDLLLCDRCTQLLRTPTPTCPYCLEPVLQDEDPRDCPQRPEGNA
jgi:hypothetical protein